MQELIKNIIVRVAAAGLSGTVYLAFHILTIITILFAAIFYGKKLGFGVKKTILIVVIMYPLMDFWKRVLFWIESGFSTFGGENNVRIFVYVPLLGFLVAKLFKIDRNRMADFLAPLIALTQGVGHIGCIFTGCCHGYPCSWGIYNIQTGTMLFPIQLIEAATALIITAYLLWDARRRNYIPNGKQYPIMLILFGFTRFIWEFFRDNEKLWLGCSSLAFHALFMFVVGVIALVVINKKQKRAEAVNS